jgi:hypothetical protein
MVLYAKNKGRKNMKQTQSLVNNNKKKRRILLGTLIPLTIVGVALGTVLPLTLCHGNKVFKNFTLSGGNFDGISYGYNTQTKQIISDIDTTPDS